MKRTLIGSLALASLTLALPLVASAQTIQGVLNTFGAIINILVVLAIGAAILVFFWGLIQYLLKAGDEKAKGLQLMLYGIVAIFVMVSIWGLVRLLGNTFLPGVSNNPLPAPFQYHP
ncbi:MAG TPA: hypothetical protein VJG64_04605 [Candidatus Paceibacterota bacterium]